MRSSAAKRKLQLLKYRNLRKEALKQAEAVRTSKRSIASSIPSRGRPRLAATQSLRNKARTTHFAHFKITTPSKKCKRNRQNAFMPQKPQSESFIMRLFDRSLDLAKYNENSSLFPICRAWIMNQPRSNNIINYRERRSPSPVKREDNAEEMLHSICESKDKEIKRMPRLAANDFPNIPQFDYEFLNKSDREEPEETDPNTLLSKHISNWKQIKKNWIRHTKEYKKAYNMTHLLIEQLYQKK
ncbi:protein lin-37 homolog [Teleopsis dalmanni]|uniref:protein lin-37 homolog n=1 Tax=Teleopsis dalmanni TaxID=139649 RepID=UPI0018CCFA12|nr:protein lin-37 homolog [Teleopsis dalmanni]